MKPFFTAKIEIYIKNLSFNTMIRQAIKNTFSFPCLLREAYDEECEIRNNRIKVRHAIHNIPFEASRVARTLQDNRMRKRLSKRIFLQFKIPMDVFDHLKDYLFENNYEFIERLPHKGYSRTIHHLIRVEYIRPYLVDKLLALGKINDANTDYSPRDYFIASIWMLIKNDVSLHLCRDICEYW